MNEPFTWGDYFFLHMLWPLLSAVLLVMAAVLGTIRGRLHCPECDRRMVRRVGKLRQYESRHYCPYHDPREA